MADSNVTTVTQPKTTIEILEVIYLSQVATFTLFGNCMVILAFVFGPRSIRTYTNFFVVNLSVSDLMVGCISIPFWIVFRADESLVSDELYNALISLDVLLGVTSILSLAAISLERIVAVKFPVVHRNLTRRPVMYVIMITWFLGSVLSVSKYGIMYNNSGSISAYTTTIFILGFILPLTIITSCYCVIWHTSVRLIRKSKSNVRNLTLMQELRIAKMIFFVIGLFILCWSPFFIVNMIFVFCEHCARPKWLVYFSKLLHYSNSMMNFIVYGVRSREFRTYFGRVLCSCREEKRQLKVTFTVREMDNRIVFSSQFSSRGEGSSGLDPNHESLLGTSLCTSNEEKVS